ncbi:DUF6402 family protein [Dyella sp. 333MFSha]|uniref:DUF6402 family protein n=1 Tax=Dyella sp. 333MFSha TaxID=1798240 RepID=UPI00088ABF96|nr:DUF6402 family protein [Dyella sp. 333MFSha]SDG20622.1 hypothetical protein SAMN04515659_2391 [Dyella sp. 333MFSha]
MIENTSSCQRVIGIRDKIESIPRAMRHMGWAVSAELMEHWLHGAAWVLPHEWKSINPPDPRTLSPSQVNMHAVRMSWALSHGHVAMAMTRLRAKMANGPARELLRKRMSGAAWGTSNRVAFGSKDHTAIQLEATCQSNIELFGDNLGTMDDLYGSLGKAAMKVVLIGEATRDARTGRISLQVTHAGYYIRDTYDFEGFQYLGTWTKDGVLSKGQMLMNAASNGMVFRWGGEPIGNIFNKDFDTYRCQTGYGGDFIIYSDVHWEPVSLLLDLG